MDINKEEYKKYVKQNAPKSPIFKDCCFAFLFGGLICVIGQLLLIFMTASRITVKRACIHA